MNVCRLADANFCRLPELFQRLQRQVPDIVRCGRDLRLHMTEAALELRIRIGEGVLGVHIEMAGQVNNRKQDVTQLIGDGLGIVAAGGFRELLQFLVDFGPDTGAIRPVEPYA